MMRVSHPMREGRSLRRGVSLVEALVAMAVMAFGMLGIVGLQSTLRQNSDVSKQRAEASRLAEAAIEDWRRFSQMGPVAAPQLGYDNIVTPINVQTIAPDANNRFNTTYTVARTVNPVQGGKSIAVSVSWLDRTNAAQSITLDTIIAAADPALSGRLTMGSGGGGAALPQRGRHPMIPMVAKDLGTGISAFKPPGSSGGVVWVFNNLTGVIVGVCNNVAAAQALLIATDVTGCSNNANGLPLNGFVRFATDIRQLVAVDAENPTSTALNLEVVIPNLSSSGNANPTYSCYSDAPISYLTAQTQIAYHCAILFGAGAPLLWSGMSELWPLAFTADLPAPPPVPWALAVDAVDASTSRYRVCRYTPAINDAQVIPNHQHPREYTAVNATEPLTNQNFLVIRAGNDSGGGGTPFICPTDVAADPANGDFVNTNTLQHQPPP